MHLRRSDIELCHPMGREMKVGVMTKRGRFVCVSWYRVVEEKYGIDGFRRWPFI